jgi:hypothetical protein
MSEHFLEALRVQREHVEARFVERHPIAGPHALKWLEDFPPTVPGADWSILEGYAAGYNQCLKDLKAAMARERDAEK